ncbi:RagB/SusD domain-containing protein [Bacteroides coprosuis DSM 18011]|uniref:RagB/SusD domain-containing protein n=1 Tax=Bacteroides coprosuis DSM 18011 TaxID=679937 RepID=F3ZSY8_9BACE|nr:RagB/SusD family nutrient uptake outer membrane protein [Bacteroides coprosuis]EGJ72229.1 RagB/SusD domain-containing protein [Bacteroides coprosuis DSM 18011]
MKILKYILGITACLFSLTSCNDSFLDRPPMDELTDNVFWQSEQQVKSAANACYDGLEGKGIINYGEIPGDNVMWYRNMNWKQIGAGQYGPDLPTINSRWNQYYSRIRKCNYFLDNYERAVMVDGEKLERFAAEVRTIRAFVYFYLTSWFGDVPLITSAKNADPYQGRTPRSEVIEFLMNDLEDAASKLPKYIEPATSDFGRISAAGAIALKARLALHNERWEDAQKACERLMPGGDLAYHELYSTGNPDEDYSDLFKFAGRASRQGHNKETIIAMVYNYDLASGVRTHHNLSRELQVPDQYCRFNPTKAFIDSYLCDDGLPIDKSPKYKGNNTTKPHYDSYALVFENRDPRLKQSIIYPGYNRWEGSEDGRGQEAIVTKVFQSPKFTNDKKGCATVTGFYPHKYCEPSKVSFINGDDNDIIIIRYGEILLIYAESMFKQGKLNQGALDKSINLLRKRVDMKPMNLGELASNNMDLETELRRERRVELFLEGLRWFDVTRWKEGYRLGVDSSESPERQEIGIIKGLRKDNVYNQNDIKNFKFDKNGYLIHDDSRIFSSPKNYMFPIPYIATQVNPNLKPNNPGWE